MAVLYHRFDLADRLRKDGFVLLPDNESSSMNGLTSVRWRRHCLCWTSEPLHHV